MSGIDVRKSIPFIEESDHAYCSLVDYAPCRYIESIDNAGDLIRALYEKMYGDTVELSIKDGNLVVSESVGYVGEMEDHIVKLVDSDFVNKIEGIVDEELDNLYKSNGFDKNAMLDDVIVQLAEKQGRMQDVVPAICKVYGWESGGKESQVAIESLDEICSAKSDEAELGQGDRGEIPGEQDRG